MNELAKPRVLVADDAAVIRSIIRLQIELAGFLPFVTSDGQEAWEEALRQDFDLVITDEQMPVLSGRELCRKLRGHPRYAAKPIIFVTCKEMELAAEPDLQELRVSAVIGKPFSPEVLRRTIQSALDATPAQPCGEAQVVGSLPGD